jgi:HEAT repeat protein
MRRSGMVLGRPSCVVIGVVVALSGVAFGQTAPAERPAERSSNPGASTVIKVPAGASVEALFTDFMHYARVGRFQTADAFAQALLAHPELEPVSIMEAANRDREAIDTLLTIMRNTNIGDNAARVLELIHKGEYEKRQSSDRILANIELLGGDPQQEFFAIKYLAESGEYAIPYLVDTLLDSSRKKLWPRVVNAIPKIGKSGVNPLVVALAVRRNDVRINLIDALGEIGYPQAIPYLRKLLANEATSREVKDAATRAIGRIEAITGRRFPGSGDELFFQLGEQYYNEDEAVRSDPRLDEANVWYWNDAAQALKRVAAPQRIFGSVMAMRSCEEALLLKSDHAEALALWLAANIRRENRLGLNVESGDPNETGEKDATRPDVFPRALYFTQTAGPRYAHRVVDRGVRDNDSAVALGAIEGLRTTAGEASLIGLEDEKQPLVQALQFPDLIVRVRAALALGAALPQSRFTGSDQVVPVLAAALAQTGREQVLVVDADETNQHRVAGALRGSDRQVLSDAQFFTALDRARKEFQTVTGVFIATDATQPELAEAVRRLRREFVYSKVPVVVMVKPQQSGMATRLGRGDPYVETVDAAADAADLVKAFDRVRSRTGQTGLSADLALSIALQSADTLRRIAVDGRTVFEVGAAESALIAALSSTEPKLQMLAASVLALLPAPTAQRAIAHVALDAGHQEPLRLSAFSSLAESGRNHGLLLDDGQVKSLVDIAKNEPDLTLRTAASQALGSLNLKTNKASEIIRSYYGG